ncbi:MAG: hypothetical protein FVQ81_13640 [Candidatus Glassbacteria bacterium]|nr:hypothetical protein [Candidatus Glassbacteria bacterium]
MAEKEDLDINSLFIVESDSILVGGLNALLKFSNFHPINTQSVREGIELANDLRSEKGTVLYPTGTEFSWERINRLLKFRESNPDMTFDIRIKPSPKLLDNLRKSIKDKLKSLFLSRQKVVVFKKLMLNLTPRFDELADKVLESDEIALEIFRIRFVCECVENQRAILFADHALNTGIFVAAIACSQQYEQHFNNRPELLVRYMTAGLFHNWGAVMESDRIIGAQAEDRQKAYWEAIQKNVTSLQKYDLGEEVFQAIHHLCGWQKEERDFVSKENEPVLSNILVVAEMFLRREDGLFGESAATKDIIDYMNVRVMDKQLNERAVKALTLGLELTDIFDFYSELDRLVKECPYDAAVPYPLTGLYSSTLFVCKKRVTKCRFLELSVRAVNLIQPLGDLGVGEYHRCKMLTPKLNSFYDDHYDDIKIAVGGGSKDKEDNGKEAPAGPGKKTGDGAPAPAKATEGDAEKADEKPAEATEKPAEATEKPAEATEKPAEADEKPAEATEKPAEATEKPAEAAENPPAEKAE